MKHEKSHAWAEIIETAVILVSAILLIMEVRANTNALEHAAYMERSATFSAPYLEVDGFTDVYQKVKAVDTEFSEEIVDAFKDRYDLTTHEAVLWVRHLDMQWRAFQADFLFGTDRDTLFGDLLYLLTYPDQRLYWQHRGDGLHPKFSAYLRSIAPWANEPLAPAVTQGQD